MKENHLGEEQKSASWQFLWIILGVSVIWILGAALIHFGPIEGTLEQKGSIGDSFGSINALFAGLAFAGVVYAILLQREELRLQREELKMTRFELARAASAQEASSVSQVEQLESQTQIARLTALTALLSWEMNSKTQVPRLSLKPSNPFGYGDRDETVNKIKSILNKLETGSFR